MNNRLFVLKNVADFAPGTFEHTLVEKGCIQLGRTGSAYNHTGCYTSPAFRPGTFHTLLPSWNADTPPGTAVEIQARVVSGGQWSSWFSFGRWSPFIIRSSPENQQDAIAKVDGEWLTLVEPDAVADTLQVRIYLYTNDPNATPFVRLLAATTNKDTRQEEEPTIVDRILQLPAYSCLVRDPSISDRIAGATSLAMLMNRWGEDVIPEEAARAGYDSGTGRYGNLAFISAVGGAYGYECYSLYTSLNLLRNEIRRSRSVGALIHYRAPSLGAQDEHERKEEKKDVTGSMPPLFSQATVTSPGHLVAVRGFVWEDEQEWIVFNDPMAPSDATSMRKIPVETFADLYMGIAFLLHKGQSGAGSSKPSRITTQLTLKQNTVYFSMHGESLEPGQTIPGDTSRSTICYTLSDGIVHASAAQKKFYYVTVKEKGVLQFDPVMAENKKLTFYLIGARGATWVGEKLVVPPIVEPETTEENDPVSTENNKEDTSDESVHEITAAENTLLIKETSSIAEVDVPIPPLQSTSQKEE